MNLGNIGNGTNTIRELTPKPVSNITGPYPGGYFPAGDVGNNHSCDVSWSGQAYCWGNNFYGQLGNGTNTNSNVPVLVNGGQTWKMITTGTFHTCGVNNLGVAYCWGRNSSGQLGDGGLLNRNRPAGVSTAMTFAGLAAGGNLTGQGFTCGWGSNGTTGTAVYCWGENSRGQLGTGSTATRVLTPGSPIAAGGLTFLDAAAGGEFACARTGGTPGKLVYCWGDNGYTQIGHFQSPAPAFYRTPQSVDLGYGFESIALGFGHVCGRRNNGYMYCWGRGDRGQLGNGFFANRPQPYPVYGTGNGVGYTSLIAAGHSHTLAWRSGGVVAWGWNQNGQLGNGTQNDSAIPTAVLFP